ncbi:DUF6879 family protein [Kitasatospora sp. NPDC087315]|uniref:DUF6879 family protein n=1 Tax=Kitasatospora sp. NPDC087315 TaxID=3364069 RepID=UPI0037FEF934
MSRAAAAPGAAWAGSTSFTRPLTDHLRFEFAHYRHSIAAGEDIRILDPPFLEFLEERG